ncbi:MAG TPA: hypothetical protein VFJ96_10915 [Gemmatimonadaceae bacterium]|nr:hypothetical protein [Gemmatimonadaceae bacterium]
MSRITRRVIVPIIAGVAVGCSHAARTPTPAPPPAPDASEATPAIPRQPIAKLAMGDAVIAVYARGDDRVEVGAGAPNGSVLLTFVPADVEQWATAATRLLKTPARTSRTSADLNRATLTEPGVAAGGITLNRRIAGRKVTYGLFFANRNFGGFPVTITKSDATVLVSTLQNAAKTTTTIAHTVSDTTTQRDTTLRSIRY